jgi:opacity protein-like surface antigen
MKKHFLSVVITIFTLTSLNAQDLQFGISGGIDAARLAVHGASGGPLKYRNDLAGGLNFEAGISSNFGVQLEVNYSRQGTGVISDDGQSAGSIQIDYLTIPVLVKLYGSPRLNFFVGPQVGLMLSAKQKMQGDPETDVKEQFKKTDFYAVFGTEYKFANGVFINARYNLGMTNIVDEDVLPDSEFKNRYFSVRIGYAFKL